MGKTGRKSEIKPGQAAVVKRQETTLCKFCFIICKLIFMKIPNDTDHFFATRLNHGDEYEYE